MPAYRGIKPFALCMTGISGSGKSTIARAAVSWLRGQGISIDLIDGDESREIVGGIFGHAKEERQKMGRVNSAIGRYLLRNGVSFILAVVAPHEEIRAGFRSFFGGAYIQVYVKASLKICAERDVKGLYKMSHNGRLSNLNGSNDVYETPQDNDLVIDTEQTGVNEACAAIAGYLCENGYIGEAG